MFELNIQQLNWKSKILPANIVGTDENTLHDPQCLILNKYNFCLSRGPSKSQQLNQHVQFCICPHLNQHVLSCMSNKCTWFDAHYLKHWRTLQQKFD